MSYEHKCKAVEQYIRSINENNLQGIVELFADDATVEDPVGTEIRKGKVAISDFYEHGAVNMGPKLALTGPIRVADNEAAFPFEVVVDSDGNRMSIQVIDIFRFNADGKVESMRAYWGPENMA
ncbi:MAG: nuclear transport factor 2 family protein [Gammaproteobacteria bacterium]|nr:nuclear transport factor 2 family protein [Gammaproteobacteria bacterium]NND38937.1 SnoaL-like domain-containing protein [Pseudomonadales bacterium]MBT8149865.1 nuclear transport factor 2 family protein [Gammaproteobacteria bacterium]NNL11864.1 SnoaL-like domain-containing protein [Pseudomonadales bacterium]NNM11940.1 SnoaL-like domain-containing protein [Pseudomonadales bacterium]